MVIVDDDFIQLPAGAADKLQNAGVKSHEQLLWFAACGQSVADQLCMSQAELDFILDSVTRRYSATPRLASEVFIDYQCNSAVWSTGCAGLDDILGGGFHTGEITELVGPSASGKTQICLSASVVVARNRRDKVAYIDGSSSLHPSRLQEIYLRMDGDDPACCPVLSGVRQYVAHDVEGLFTQLDEIEIQLNAVADAQSQDEFYLGLRMVVVDAIGTMFAAAVGGQGMVGHAQLVTAVYTMQRIATQHNVAFVVCNHTTGVKQNGTGDPEQAALGQTWPFLPCVSVSLSSVEGSMYEAVTRKSNQISVGRRARFYITERGVVDGPHD